MNDDLTMSKHTPGPWQEHGSHVYGPDPVRRLICQVNYDGTPEDMHNARLIKVAPELLESLKNARALLANALQTDTVYVPQSDPSGHPHGWCAVRIPDWRVKQALEWMDQDIAKAEGRI